MGPNRRFLAPVVAAFFFAVAAPLHAAPGATTSPSSPPSRSSSNTSQGSKDKAATPRSSSSTNGKHSSTGGNRSSASSASSPAHGNSTSSAKSTSSTTKPARAQDTTVRRQVAGGPTLDDTAVGADTPELRALYAAERELFPPASPNVGTPWPQELPFPVAGSEDRPRVHASGLPPPPVPSGPPPSGGAKDLSWLAKLELPDLPVRWDARVVRYLEFFKDDARGRSTMTTWLRRSGRYRDGIRKAFRRKGLPEDLTWLAMVESGFDATARSPVGAAGLWQFMPETGKIYGLTVDRWADQRLNLSAATEAAADFLADLHRRFGSWDLAMAGYNMGYGGVLSAVRRYNTNDYWALAKLEGSFPWETTLYVPKIVAVAIVARNLAAFGYQDVQIEPPLEGEDLPVGPGTALATVAQACGVTTKEVEQLNPELRASRTPPAQEDWMVKVPVGKASSCGQSLARTRREQSPTERYVVRFGETLEQIAQARRITVAKLVELNAIVPGEVVRGGTVLIVPKMDAASADAKSVAEAAKPADKPIVVVPQDVFVYPDRRRVFYRVQVGDTVREVCAAFKVTADELRRWNEIDPSARLVEGMTLQVFPAPDADLTKAVVLGPSDVRIVAPGTDEFLQAWDEKGRHRVVVNAKSGDTLESIGKRYNVSVAMMERINRRGRSEILAEGDRVVVWAPPARSSTSASAQASVGGAAPGAAGGAALEPALPTFIERQPTPPLGTAPAPDALPPLR